MKRIGFVLLAACLALPLAVRLEARMPGARSQRDDRDQRDNRDQDHRDSLVINRAIYGAGKKMHDITAPLNAEVHDGRLRIPVTNGTMGGDPAKNKPKTLQVWYTFNGRQFQVTLNENDMLDLPGREALGGDRDRGNDGDRH
jgi:DnaJ-like protein